MIVTALNHYIGTKHQKTTDSYSLSYAIQRKERFPLNIAVPSQINIVLEQFSRQLDYTEYQHDVNDILRFEHITNRIRCNWFVCSKSGSIYLHEAMTSESKKMKSNSTNRFVIINHEDGTISFGPGHPSNSLLSERMSFLISERRKISKEVFKKELEDVFSVCVQILK